MSTIVTRAGKGSALTHNEVDANFTNLNTDKLQSGNTAAALTITSATINGGAINATTVGGTTAAAGAFTTLTATSGVISSAATSDAFRITNTGTGNSFVVEDAANPDSTPFVVDASGRLLIGQTSTYIVDSNGSNPLVQISNAVGPASYEAIKWNAASSFPLRPPAIRLAVSDGASTGTQGIVANNRLLGLHEFYGSDGTTFIQAASITASVDGTPGTNDMPGRLIFSTTADGASSPTERMRIDSTGTVTLAASSGLQISKTGVTSPAATDGNVFSGTYTPTQVSTNTNVDAVTFGATQYMRVGNTVTVSGAITIDPTSATTDTIVRMSLPIASAFTLTRQLGGTGFSIPAGAYATTGAVFLADATNDCVEIRLRPATASGVTYNFSFTYTVI